MKNPYSSSWFLKELDLIFMIVAAHLCAWMTQYLGTFQIYCLQENRNYVLRYLEMSKVKISWVTFSP